MILLKRPGPSPPFRYRRSSILEIMLRSMLPVFPLLTGLMAYPQGKNAPLTHADTLRGSIGPERAWWDVTHYSIDVRPDLQEHTIAATTAITFKAIAPGGRMQIDLQQPLKIDEVRLIWSDVSEQLPVERDSDLFHVDVGDRCPIGSTCTLTVRYSGHPREARNAPWDGGWVWRKGPEGDPFVSVACQGIGASVWYPCKDTQADEPDSAELRITVPDTLQAIGNGRLRGTARNNDGTATWTWAVVSPINNYDIIPYIGKYAHIHDTYAGLDGPLDLDYWVLALHEAEAREHFKEVPIMLHCFEEPFGPYPFYVDGYKLVEAPYLGMEHQSAVAYGNGFQEGYRGMDLSGTGWGKKWDYIIVHESGHEWFGNSITTADIADMWVHEGFTDYSETIYVQCVFGEEAGDDYVIGLRRNIRNDRPIIGPYGVNKEGSTDMYYKGANLIHTIRHAMNDDQRFFAMLREMNARFRHQVVTSRQIEAFISDFSGMDLGPVFDQYLRTTQVPVLQWGWQRGQVVVRWSNCIDTFHLPVRLLVDDRPLLIDPRKDWTPVPGEHNKHSRLAVDRNWYVGEEHLTRKAMRKTVR
ncbi:MAG: M1 family metallopeptidase [Flavobacteriales bacterium]|nr:M1 family metallopeptidase [Flavobacteriales bacterium]